MVILKIFASGLRSWKDCAKPRQGYKTNLYYNTGTCTPSVHEGSKDYILIGGFHATNYGHILVQFKRFQCWGFAIFHVAENGMILADTQILLHVYGDADNYSCLIFSEACTKLYFEASVNIVRIIGESIRDRVWLVKDDIWASHESQLISAREVNSRHLTPSRKE